MSVVQSVRGAVISSVNVKFLRFTYAFTLAAIVGILTLAGVGVITYYLVTTCTLTCRSIPLALVASETVSKLSCVGFRTRALSLSLGISEQSRAVFNDLLSASSSSQPSTFWNGYAWTTSAATLGKCSYQHAADCALQEWLSTFQGLAALSQIGNGSETSNTAKWPALSFYNSSKPLTSLRDTVGAAAVGSERLTVAAVDKLLSAGTADLSSDNTTLFQAPSTATCCDITNSNTKLGQFGGGSTRFVLNIQGRSNIGMNITTCSINTTATQRCSWVGLSAAMVVPPPDVVNQKLCTDYWNQAQGIFQMPVGVSASICQSLGEQLGTFDVKPAPQQICLNGSTNNGLVLLTDQFTVTGACPTAAVPNPAVAASATPKPWAQRQQAAIRLMLPLAHEFGMSVTWYLSDAQVNISNAAQGLNAIKNGNEAASWWMENYLYCCTEVCNTWLSSVGSALGYESYVEGAIALIILIVYLTMHKAERLRLGLTDFKTIGAIAFESETTTAAAADVKLEGQPAAAAAEQKDKDAVQAASATGEGSLRSSKVSSSREDPYLPGSTARVHAWDEG